MHGWGGAEADEEPDHQSLQELKRNARDQGQEPPEEQAVHDQVDVEWPSRSP